MRTHPAKRRDRTPIASLRPEDRATVMRFNAYLADLERFILQEAEPLDRALQARLDDLADPMIDYELEAVVSYYLRQDDPAYRDDDDNILAQRDESLKGISTPKPDRPVTLLNDECNYNDLPALAGEFHCWMYHDLCDHSYGEEREYQALDWPDILRIGSVWLDLQVTQQYHATDPFKSTPLQQGGTGAV